MASLSFTRTTSALVNPLATNEQLQISSSQLDGVPVELENSIRFAASRFIQAAGILLGLSQDIIAQAIIIFARFWISPEGGSLRLYGAEEVATAALYLVAKTSPDPQSPRRVMLVTAYLHTHPRMFLFSSSSPHDEKLYASLTTEESYESRRSSCMRAEAILLRVLGFQTHVALPYTLCIHYLRTLRAFEHPNGQKVAARAFAHLNSALFSPQLVYLTHQPTSLATASIYLAAREVGLKLPEIEWWEVFDTDREELGFLVVSLTSMKAFVTEEERRWKGTVPPLDNLSVTKEIDRARDTDGTREASQMSAGTHPS